jgi:FlaA1/EpsC-like NDP-sugar epimerase
LNTIAIETASKMLVIAMPSATAEQMQRVVGLCDETGLPFRTVRRMSDMLESPHGFELKEVAIEDLLGRKPVNFDWEKVSMALGGKHVLITGAGGSIGSELVRQCARAGAARLVLMERHELALHDLLIEMRRDFPHVALQPMLADCGDPAACRLALRGIEMVFHAAAFKHVPMLEHQLREAMRNNVLASVTLMRACCEAKVPEFVLISTDKAIAPANVLGASKRFAELACQLEGARGGTRLTVVRFGNVLDSAGSVVPLFRKQIAAGGPVTVTDPEVTRFFMTIPEACQLILQTSLLESLRMAVYTLDMGQPIAIRELAQQMIRLAGKRPERDIEIVYTGLRAGEKLHELLFHPDESYLPTRHPRILQARPRPLDAVKMEKAVERLARLLSQGSDDLALLMLLQEVVTDFEPGPGLQAMIEADTLIDQQSSA